MHDLKYFSRNRKIVTFFSKRHNKSRNSFRIAGTSKVKQKRLRIILPILAVLLAIYPFSFAIKAFVQKVSLFMHHKSVSAQLLNIGPDTNKAFLVASQSLVSAHVEGDALVAPTYGGGSILFTIDPALQMRVQEIMRSKDVPYGVFVAIEPKSGKILAMSGYSSVDSTWGNNPYFNLYPMASLFKIITAAAALELKKVEPETLFAYRGASYSENPKYWGVNPGQSTQSMPLSLALGKSINPVFGRLASDYVGVDTIMTYAQRFGFNQTLFPGTPVKPSRAAVPNDDSQLRLMGAGLGREVKISPLHAAVIMAAIANQGKMMTPLLAQEIRDKGGNVLYSTQSRSIRKLVVKETADQLTRMLLTTVTKGTSRKAFHDRRGRPLLASINVAAKTGSINGTDPSGHYSWFAAFAPVEDPQIAIVALIINQDKWKIKATYLGEQALEQFFAEKKTAGFATRGAANP
ncbi:MAG: penicillin-binding transpeptidase domain-containing protein [Geobacteraceae bacterium]|nr:penicillin-binding transpeptidase domain-containing protein [Geobacteraceae bacterium]